MMISSASNRGGGGGRKKKKVVELVVKYRECLRNHAAAMGGYVTDGCGEFMPSSGSDDLNCSACHCHRNFHRKESQQVIVELEEGEPSTTTVPPPPPPHHRVESESEKTLQPPPGFNKKLMKFRKLADCYTQLPSKTTAVKLEEEEELPALHHLPEPQNQVPNNDKLIPDQVELITPPPHGINNNKESCYYYYSDDHDHNLNKALMAVDVKEYQNYYEFVMDMPGGLKTQDMMIEVEAHNVLLISCERKRKELEEGSSSYKYLKSERRVGKFMRKFLLPENANARAVSAFRQNGLLIVSVEKLPPPPSQADKPKSSNIVGPVGQPVLDTGPGPASKPKDLFVYFSRRRKHSSGVES